MMVHYLQDDDLMLSQGNKKDEIKWSCFQGGGILIDINSELQHVM